MPDIKLIDDLDLQGRTVLVRCDLNVPVQDGKVTDTNRIDRLLPTLKELGDKGAKVVMMSHFGRPKGAPSPEFSLNQVLPALTRLLGRHIAFAEDCIGPAAEKAIAELADGAYLLLENVRFHAGEERNDPEFAKALAALGDVYINDAFATAHRAHASTEALAHLLPAAAGRLMQAEIEALSRALEQPERPVAALVGGAKISSKLDLLGNLVEKVDRLVLGGGMANTFLYADGVDVGASLCERDMAEQARAIRVKAEDARCQILLPVDGVVADELKPNVPTQIAAIRSVPADGMILDIGPQTIDLLTRRLRECNTIVWNGPLGAFEVAPFDQGTTALARFVANLTDEGEVLSVAGGGDTVSALAHAGVMERFSYISTAGGAFLEWLEGKTLPGVAALKK